MIPVGFLLQCDTKGTTIIIILIKLFSIHLSFEAGYLSPMVSISIDARYYILVSYRSQNYGIEPSLACSLTLKLCLSFPF